LFYRRLLVNTDIILRVLFRLKGYYINIVIDEYALKSLADPKPEFGGHMVSAEREPMTEVWAELQQGQGAKTPEAERLLHSQPEESVNLH